MTTQIKLIIGEQQVPRGIFVPARPSRPDVAVVYSTGFGEVVCFDGKPQRRSEQTKARFRFRYDVDMSDHRRLARLDNRPLPAAGDAYNFEAEVDVGFRVSDPEAIVLRRIDDALPVVYGFLLNRLRPITRRYDIRSAAEAEAEINTLFSAPTVLPEGIMIYHCTISLAPDQMARTYLRTLVESARTETVGQAKHGVDVAAARHAQTMAELNLRGQQALDRITSQALPDQHADEILAARHRGEIARIEQASRLENERQEREALGGVQQDLWGLLTVHLQRHPDETAYATELYARHMEAVQVRRDINDQRSLELVRYMMDRELIQPVDVARLRDDALGRVQQIASPDRPEIPAAGNWDDPLPEASGPIIPGTAIPTPQGGAATGTQRVTPVYVVVDESVAQGGYLESLNAGLAALPDALAADPDTVGTLRLALLGYAEDLAVRIPMTGIAHGSLVPALKARRGCRLAPVFTDLRARIEADVERLKGQGSMVSRPTVVLLSAAPAADPAEWPAAHRHLTDRSVFRYAPQIVACGVGQADPGTVARVASPAEQAFVAGSTPDGESSVRAFTAFLARFVTHVGRVALTGGDSAAFDRPAGFVRAATPPEHRDFHDTSQGG